MKEMPKSYDHQGVEDRLYEKWEKNGYFHAEPNPDKEPYCIVIPPPNITGQLHIGHAIDETLQDALIRYKRMAGFETLWLPGTDHASIATEVKIIEQMAKEGLDKRDIGREAFLRRAWDWKKEYGGRIVKQLRKLGASCDWDRERFTMDEGCSKAVTKVFVDLYNKGLIYRGDRIINWCPHCKTALSDAEVEYEEQQSHLWHVRYDAPDKSYSITVATTRPETILGDTAIAVHPDDERYAGIVGKTVVIPVVGREIPIVADGRIVKQLRKLGASCDWDRERFTMDEGCSKAVTKVFVDLYNKGLIYRGDRIINWCPHCKTALSDAEVEYEEQQSHLWHVRYDAPDKSYSITVATTRPETILGDTAIAVHPDDERYAGIVGKTVVIPVVGREIPIVADEYVEKEFGTGAVKITPAHDPNDFEVGVRCNLPVMRVFTDDGHINELGGAYEGLTTMECRKKLVADIEAAGNLVKIEPYGHNVGTCYRCHSTVEPLVSKQWFVSMKPLAKPAIDVVKSGEVKFVPERFDKTYYNWMENIRDWCISRQLWWGHRIPAYYCDDCGETIVAESAPACCPKCGGHVHQDEDVLDTWFSSGMWPFSTLGWPEHTKELEYFYPTSTLVTGYDIIFFWVARMIVFGMEVMHQKPFSHVYIHGLVRDELGRKMSKSLGNGVDPLEIIKQYGADSLRFSLVTGNGAGGDMRFGTKKVEAARNFCNKLYNATRFVLMNIGDAEVGEIDIAKLDIADKWLLNRLNTIIREITANMDGFDLNLAAQKIYDFVWTEFCDWYIELAKPRMNGDDEEQKANVRAILCRALTDSLKLLHPFMPFITEELYLNLPNSEETIMRSAWPTAQAEWDFPEEAETMEEVMDLIRATRNIRAEMSVAPSRKLSMTLVTHGAKAEALEASIPYIMKLAGAEHVAIQQDKTGIPENAVSAVAQAAEAFIPLSDLIDVDKERERLNKEAAKVRADIERSSGKLNNAGFVAKAPEKVIAEERKKLAAAEDMLGKLEARLEQLNKM